MTTRIREALKALPGGAASLVREVVGAADAAQVPVYLVGGPIRDWLLERAVRDVDLLLEASPDAAREMLLTVLGEDGEISEHSRFGTFRLVRGEVGIDITTARREHYAHDGALPVVVPSGLDEDLGRRDFTCNALALPLSRAARRGRDGLVDPGTGLDDLRNAVLRVQHRTSFREDPTRVMRAARLLPRLGFSLSRDSRAALRDALRAGAFGRVSGERLRREWVRCFEDPSLGLDPARTLRLLDEWHVLTALEPGLSLPREAVAPLRRVGRFLERPAFAVGRLQAWRVGLMLWLGPQPAGLRRRTLRRLAVRGAAAERIVGWPRTRERVLRRVERAHGRGAFDAALRGVGEEELLGLYVAAPAAVRRRIARYAAEDRHRRLPIAGSDLAALGLEGPPVGRVLERVRKALLDGQVRNREEALVLAGELARRRRSES